MTAKRFTNILVTGSRGFLGAYVVEELKRRGISARHLRLPTTENADLRRAEECTKAVEGRDLVIHLAADFGGLKDQRKRAGEIFYNNAMMGLRLMDAARNAGVKKFVTVGSVACYPARTAPPFREEDFWNGKPESGNAAYAEAKRILLLQGNAYRAQYGFDVVFLVLPNLYGACRGAASDSWRSHAIPTFIRAMQDAQRSGKTTVDFWGSGAAKREYLYVSDAAWAIVEAAFAHGDYGPLNVGPGDVVAVRDLVASLVRIGTFSVEVRWDPTVRDGQAPRFMESSTFARRFPFPARIGLIEGLWRTIEYCKESIHFS